MSDALDGSFMEQQRLIDQIKQNTGWIVAAWGFLVSMLPSLDRMIAMASFVVLILQGLILCRKLRKDKVNEED